MGTVILVLLLAGCIDPIDFAIDDVEERVVVEGTLVDGGGPHELRLTLPAGFQGLDAVRQPIRNAMVEVRDGHGTAFPAGEASPGRYVIPDDALVAEVGGSYSLHVQLEDGRRYSSPPQTMPRPGEMADVTANYERLLRLFGGSVLSDVPSVTIRLNASTDSPEPLFLRWTWSGTWETDFCFRDNPRCLKCYISEMGDTGLQIADAPLTAGQELVDQLGAVFYLPDEPERFGHAFAVTVVQESMTEEAYRYWQRVRDQRDSVGSLFDAPAGNVWGNLVNEDDPEDFTLGYFTVASTRSESICMKFADFPNRDPIVIDGFFLVGMGTLGAACETRRGGSIEPPSGFLTLCDRPGG